MAEQHFPALRHKGNTLHCRGHTRELMTGMGQSSSRAALIYQHTARAIADRLVAMNREGGGRGHLSQE